MFIVAVILDSLLWVIPFTPLARRWGLRGAVAVLIAAGALLVITAACRMRDRSEQRVQAMAAEYERREAALIKTFAALTADRNPTGPMPRLYRVPRQ